ncbi:MAG: Ig-like domain-containing protein, partial [Candidatus Muiribacteriaceae bacterium]
RVKDSIKNLKGQNLDRYYEWTFVTEPTPDRQPPEILDVSPGDGEENIASDVGIKIRFDENIREESMNKFTFRVTDGNEYIKTDISYDKEKFIAFVNPVHKLKDGVKYKVIVSQGVSDIAGNFMKQDYSWSFWCGEPPDNTPPQIMAISPRENAPVYTTRPVVSVNFNEEMDTSTLTPFNFGLLEGERPVPGVIEYSSITNTVVYNYFEKLEYGTIYTVFITDRITDVSGNRFPKNIVWDFIISHEKTTMPEVIGSYPMEGKMNFPGTADIVVQWNKDMNPVSFNRFTVKLRDVKGQRIFGDIVYNKENRELKFTPFRKLQYNTRYTLSINRYVQDTEGKNMDESHFLTFYTEGRGHNETEIED